MAARFVFFISLLTALAARPAQAAVYTVGADGACTHATIADAITSAESHPGADTIRVARNRSYTQQALTLSTSQELEITGGFADCAQAASDGNLTTIDGAGGATEPVFRITADSGALVRLAWLTIRGGDEDGRGYGGGIYFKGDGILQIDHSTITANSAGYGGGIYAQGTGRDAELVIGEGVQILANTARYSGGGVYDDGLEMTMVAPDSWIAGNHAPGVLNTSTGEYDGGYAGGLMVLSGDLPAYAYIGSGGIGSAGPIYLNDARYGGGVAVVAHDEDAVLQLFTTNAAQPVRIKSNSASVAGGGVYFEAGRSSKILAWYAFIEDNVAPQGAALFHGGSQGADVWFNRDAAPPGTVPCPVDAPCGAIADNVAEDEHGEASGGIIDVRKWSWTDMRRIAIVRNRGRDLVRAHGSSGSIDVELDHVLIADNVLNERVLGVDDDTWDDGIVVQLDNATVAGNSIGADSVLKFRAWGPDGCWIRRSIIWQPGKTTLETAGEPLSYLTDIVSEVGSLAGSGPEAVVAEPRFVDPGNGDYALRAASPAVDAAPTLGGDTLDLYGRNRVVDLPVVENSRGPSDIGAIERQTLLPLVLNGDFDDGLAMWSNGTNVSSWDSTQNASGGAGSGSAMVRLDDTAPGQRVYGLTQCVHLPGPGTYVLNGWGRSGAGPAASRDAVRLLWEFRRAGGEECTLGAADAAGDLHLTTQNAWVRPAAPALITVSAADWTYLSSIAITPFVVENGVASPTTTVGWFDGVTLDVVPSDVIFADDFEP
ncbi:MAG TPA: hypothetical protein VGC30_03715 [Dokdonella sp.]